MKPSPALLPALSALAISCAAHGSTTQVGNAEQADLNVRSSANRSQWVGTWRLTRQPPQARPGFSVEVAFDSVLEGKVYGKLVSFFAGNVGIDPTRYGAFSAELGPDSLLAFTIAPADSAPPRALFFSGTLGADTLRLRRFAIGRDTVAAGATRWFLVKR